MLLRSKKKIGPPTSPLLLPKPVPTIDLQVVPEQVTPEVTEEPTIPKPATPDANTEVSIISSSGEVESNLATSVGAIIPQLEKSGETLGTLLSELQTEWKAITAAYDETKNSLQTTTEEYNTIVSETFDKKDFTFNQNKTT